MACSTRRCPRQPLNAPGTHMAWPFHDPEAFENPVKLRIGAKIAPLTFAARPRTPAGARRRAIFEL
ncbi:hypothetical protein CO2235_180105 [Cupriavidus oxalaticus]|uniref:Uncharacterized protein n=1 Tax=Cupriavidus oxalaticus TaxID=96344 RepID=A0A976G9M1_9BURK|nr:hypothetical protein CO2235_180105 [Cupriavidus oxalaticus]